MHIYFFSNHFITLAFVTFKTPAGVRTYKKQTHVPSQLIPIRLVYKQFSFPDGKLPSHPESLRESAEIEWNYLPALNCKVLHVKKITQESDRGWDWNVEFCGTTSSLWLDSIPPSNNPIYLLAFFFSFFFYLTCKMASHSLWTRIKIFLYPEVE